MQTRLAMLLQSLVTRPFDVGYRPLAFSCSHWLTLNQKLSPGEPDITDYWWRVMTKDSSTAIIRRHTELGSLPEAEKRQLEKSATPQHSRELFVTLHTVGAQAAATAEALATAAGPNNLSYYELNTRLAR
jgi:hypothetical protein